MPSRTPLLPPVTGLTAPLERVILRTPTRTQTVAKTTHSLKRYTVGRHRAAIA